LVTRHRRRRRDLHRPLRRWQLGAGLRIRRVLRPLLLRRRRLLARAELKIAKLGVADRVILGKRRPRAKEPRSRDAKDQAPLPVVHQIRSTPPARLLMQRRGPDGGKGATFQCKSMAWA
jgi:hypothetical protein